MIRSVLSILGLKPHAWKAILAVLLCLCGTSSPAQPSVLESVWSTYNCTSCHGKPPSWVSVNAPVLDAFATGRSWSLNGARSACSVPGLSNPGVCFKEWFDQVGLTEGMPMSTFANTLAPGGDSTSTVMGQYVLNLLQGAASPASYDFGHVLDGNAPGPKTFALQNFRPASVTFDAPTLAAPFSVDTSGCPGNTVPAATTLDTPGSCIIAVAFDPRQSAATLGPQSPRLAITFHADSSGGQAPGPISWNATTSHYDVSPLQIPLAGAGYGIPQARVVPIAPIVAAGDTVKLDGSGSMSPNTAFAALQYRWQVAGPGAPVDQAASIVQLTPSTPGDYTAVFTAYDVYATQGSATSQQTKTLHFTVVGHPTATLSVSPAAGPYYLGTTVAFTVAGSLPQGASPLHLAWTISPQPTANQWSIDAANAKAYLTLADTQAYTVSVAVDDQGVPALTQPSPVTITPSVTSTPTATIANSVRTVLVNTPVSLTATAHADNGVPTCTWTIVPPSGPAPAATPVAACGATFMPTVTGRYDVTLHVFDGFKTGTATAQVTASNLEIIVNAGGTYQTILNSPVTLSGSATSTIGDTPVPTWSVIGKPDGSTPVISPLNSLAASFTADVAGPYVVQLSATDQHNHTGVDSATISVALPLSAPGPSLPFSASLGSSNTASTNVTNNTGAPLTLQSLSFGGTTPGDYALAPSNNCGTATSIAAGSSCRLAIVFTPGAEGARSATVLLAYPGAGSPLSINLLGMATPRPQGVLSSTDWAPTFPDTVVGTTSNATITLSNASTGPSAAPLTLSSFTLVGAAASDYQSGGNCVTVPPPVLPPGGACTLTFTFAPSTSGTRAASLDIASDATHPLLSVTLGGNGLPAPAPALGVSPNVLDFGTQTVGGAYPPQPATLTNTGTATLTISAVTIAGTGFAIVDASACTGASLAVHASCRVVMSFAPPSVQSNFTGTLAIASNIPGSPITLNLIGTGTAAAAPVLAWATAPTRLDFGTVQAGAISAAQSVVLTNLGPGGASLSYFNAVGIGSAAFTIDPGTCPTSQPLFAGSSCRLDISFAPTASGSSTATLQVVSNGSTPAPVTLAGTGTGSPSLALALSTNALDFGTVQLGTRSQPAMLRLSNSGSGSLQVASISASGAFSIQGASCPPTPFTLQSGAECTVAVTYAPTVHGPAVGTLSVQSDAQARPGDVVLAGTADDAPDLSKGGCSIGGGDGTIDPTLWALGMLAIAALAYRAHHRRRDERRRARLGS